MKLIDLYNKIAKGEELPIKFKFDDVIYYLQVINHNECYYRNTENNDILEEHFVLEDLNKEIEIIEDIPQKDKIISDQINLAFIDKEYLLDEKDVNRKINEIINRHNFLVDKLSEYLKSKGE